IMLNPLLYRCVGPMERALERHPRIWRALNRTARFEQDSQMEYLQGGSASHRAVIVGYGPIGQMLFRILQQGGIEPTVIEMNIETYRKLRSDGRRAVHGDANRREVLEQAGVDRAASLIMSASGTAAAAEAIRAAREINPGIHVVARADYIGETKLLRQAGASEVFSGEGEVALAIADSILR